MLTLGIDEAGRGPLIGDMFVAGLVIESKNVDQLRLLGVKDSKLLTPKKRLELLPHIIMKSKLAVISRITPEEIDRENLNKLFIERIAKIVSTVVKKIGDVDQVIIDSAGNKYMIEKLIKGLCPRASIIIEYKADAKFIEVSAASIVAKSLRDLHISMLKKVYGELGSGYPSDPKTIKWVRNYYEEHKTLPPIVRKKWLTVKKVLNKQKKLF